MSMQVEKMHFVDSNDYTSQDLLYMKSIIEIFIKHFHNMFLQLISEVLKIKEGDYKRTVVEFCDKNSFISAYNYEPVVESNYWYCTESSRENEILLNFKRIGYLSAKAMEEKWINFEEKDLKCYGFNDINLVVNQVLVEKMFSKLEKYHLDQTVKRTVEEMTEVQVNKSFDFIIEIDEFIYQNFLFSNSNLMIR